MTICRFVSLSFMSSFCLFYFCFFFDCDFGVVVVVAGWSGVLCLLPHKCDAPFMIARNNRLVRLFLHFY